MSQRYAWLLGGVVLAGVALSLSGRAPAGAVHPVRAPHAPTPVVRISLQIVGGAISPSTVRVRNGERVALTVENSDRVRAKFTLPGYDDHLSPFVIEPGASWTGGFLADRPGEDFAWGVNGKPAGRLIVAGSHLIEGHE